MGGLSKKSSLLKSLATTADILKIDAGTLFFDEKLTGQPERLTQAVITASAMVEAYNHMAYDAVAIGSQDLAAGLDALQTLAKQASFPFLSANLVDRKGALLFPAVAYVERAGMRIALIGLTGQTKLTESCSDSVKILPWQEVLPPMMAKIAAKSDFVILLSNLSASENKAIAQEMVDIHLLLQSGVNKQNMRPQIINNTLITHAGHDGKYQGQLTVTWSAARTWQQGDKSRLDLQKEYDRLGWLISRVRKKGGPQLVYKDNKANQDAFAQKLARYQELEMEIKTMAQDDKKNTPPAATYSNHFHPLSPSLPDDAVITQLLQNARREGNKVRRQGADTRKLDQYIGSDACRSCHEPIYQAWSQTGHASSYQTLQQQDQNNNLTCVYCHVTGLGENTAYLATSLPENMKAVGCEACHGPGKKHGAQPRLSPLTMAPDAKLCLNCHNVERDDNFDYLQDNERVH